MIDTTEEHKKLCEIYEIPYEIRSSHEVIKYNVDTTVKMIQSSSATFQSAIDNVIQAKKMYDDAVAQFRDTLYFADLIVRFQKEAFGYHDSTPDEELTKEMRLLRRCYAVNKVRIDETIAAVRANVDVLNSMDWKFSKGSSVLDE